MAPKPPNPGSHETPDVPPALARKPKIVVAGDVAIDWLQVPTEPMDVFAPDGAMRLNWQLYPGTRMLPKAGGTWLLARMIRRAGPFEVATHREMSLDHIQPEVMLHSIILLDRRPLSREKKDEKNLVYRVGRLGGFHGPAAGLPELQAIEDDDPDAPIVVLDDAGNGFRDRKDAWPAAIRTEGKQPIVIYKMSRPLLMARKGRRPVENPLWKHVRQSHADRTVLVIRADDLREEGANISRCLSWERTATDFVWQMACNRTLAPLTSCMVLVVVLGLDGAILYSREGGTTASRLYYDPTGGENCFCQQCPGDMVGVASAFVASLVGRVAEAGLDALGDGVRRGLHAARRLYRGGFGKDLENLDYPAGEVLGPPDAGDPPIAEVQIPPTSSLDRADPGYWCILGTFSRSQLEDLAYDIVRSKVEVALQRALNHGTGGSALPSVPLGCFGNLKTVDRAEIESFRSIANLMHEYLDKKEVKAPLSIAVFGPPGSGKSFGVKEVAESIAPGRVEKREFNVSQFRAYEDLVSALHQVRDIVLCGKVPLVFFDEFDSSLGQPLGWLKYFLVPMQEGKFRDKELEHPIGRAIFVFAGGTSYTFQDFDRKVSGADAAAPGDATIRESKGRDFVSRLRGYVNILGPNPADDNDTFCMVRRAIMLRFQLETLAKDIFDRRAEADIDPGVLRAMIKVPFYKHGVRSIAAILEMSMLAGHTGFAQADLPSPEQLKLHVDADVFRTLVVRDAIFGAAREKIARAFHERYVQIQVNNGVAMGSARAMQPWDPLPRDLKESNCNQADHIPSKLHKVGYDFAPLAAGLATASPWRAGAKPPVIQFSGADIEDLARMEHERWCDEKKTLGWKHAEKRNDDLKQHPLLVPWAELPPAVKAMNRDEVLAIPDIMANAGFEVYALGPKKA